MESDKVRGIIEAILLTADTPVSPGRLVALFDDLTAGDVRAVIDALNARYEETGQACTIVEIAGGYQLATRPEFGSWVREFHRDRGPTRLSQAGLETLAIVAFKQPVTRVEIEAIRGVNSGGVLRTLMEFNLVRIVGRSEGIGRPMLFGTTRDFLIHFGLKTLADLPKPQELEELLAKADREADARAQQSLEMPAQELGEQDGEGHAGESQERTGGEAGEPVTAGGSASAEEPEGGEHVY